MGHVDETAPGKLRGFLLIPFVLENLQAVFHQADFLAGRFELSQGYIGPGAQDVPFCAAVGNLIEIFQIGGGLHEAKPHLGGIALPGSVVQSQQLAAEAVVPYSQPVQLTYHGILILLYPGSAQQGPVNLTEQSYVQFVSPVEKHPGELGQICQLRSVCLKQAVQQGKKVFPQQCHVPFHSLFMALFARKLFFQKGIEALEFLSALGCQAGDFF